MSNASTGATGTQLDNELPGIITHLTGNIGHTEVSSWLTEFETRVKAHPGRFKLLVDTEGYEPQSFDVHEKWRKALVETCRGKCLSVAFVHHDRNKMARLQAGAPDEQGFFDDYDEAYQWLKGRPTR